MGSAGAPNALDAILALLLVVALLRGWRQGAVLQIAALAGLVLGLALGLWAAPLIAGRVTGKPGPETALLTLVVLLGAILLGQAITLRAGRRLYRAAERVGVERVDRAIGVGVGGVVFLLFVWLMSSALTQGPTPAIARQVNDSTIVRALDGVLPPPPDVLGRIAGLLDQQGFPQVFAGPGGSIAAPASVPATAGEAVRAAARAGQPSTVQVRAFGCGAVVGFGSGFVTQPGFVVTNAHVVSGFGQLRVRDAGGEHTATPIFFDPALDIAVLEAPQVVAKPIGWAGTRADRGTEGAILGFPGGQREMVVLPATVRARLDAVGRDIYGQGIARREILALAAPVERGDSGGPFVTRDGLVGGVVFAGDPGGGATGYALTSEEVRRGVEPAIAARQPVAVGACRF
jgi:S1-C subfamily serine protease